MKKYLLAGGLATVLLLGGCGGETESEEAETEQVDVEETTDESEVAEDTPDEPEVAEDTPDEPEVEETDSGSVNMMGGDEPSLTDYEELFGFDMSNATEDVMAFATNPDIDVYADMDSLTAYNKLKTYTTEDADENGTLSFEAEGYEEAINVLLVEDDMGDTHILILGEEINGTDQQLYSGLQHDITTDTMEQLRTSEIYGFALGGTYEPNTRHRGGVTATLEFPEDLPTELNIQFEGVYHSNDGSHYADDYFIMYNPVTFTELQ